MFSIGDLVVTGAGTTMSIVGLVAAGEVRHPKISGYFVWLACARNGEMEDGLQLIHTSTLEIVQESSQVLLMLGLTKKQLYAQWRGEVLQKNRSYGLSNV